MEQPKADEILKAQEQVQNKQRMHNEKAEKAKQHYNKLLHQVFQENQYGSELLNIWISNYLVSQTCADPNKDASHAFCREGENNFIRRIVDGIQQHKGTVEHG